MPDKTWKQVERRVAKMHGTTRTGPTGIKGPDAVTDWLAIQVKHRKVLPQWMGDALRLIRSQAGPGQLGIVVAHELYDRDSWVIMSHKDFLDWFGGQKNGTATGDVRDQGESGQEQHDAGRV